MREAAVGGAKRREAVYIAVDSETSNNRTAFDGGNGSLCAPPGLLSCNLPLSLFRFRNNILAFFSHSFHRRGLEISLFICIW